MKSLNQNSGLGSLDSFPSVVVVDIGRLPRAMGFFCFFAGLRFFRHLFQVVVSVVVNRGGASDVMLILILVWFFLLHHLIKLAANFRHPF